MRTRTIAHVSRTGPDNKNENAHHEMPFEYGRFNAACTATGVAVLTTIGVVAANTADADGQRLTSEVRELRRTRPADVGRQSASPSYRGRR
jgi:hypothetical protein